ncbi:MAG: dihydroorotase [bacterium]|nr:dihydroorotase [bacterium]
MTELTIIRPDDFHNHLRQGELMPHLVQETEKVFGRTLVMPNTLPPVVTGEDLQRYRSELESVGADLQFLMTFKIIQETKPEMITGLKSAGAIAGKLYPQGVTTNAEDGVEDVENLFPVFEAMQQENVVLCIHGELSGVEDLQREEAFLPTLKKIHSNFSKLRIVLEHVSTEAAVQLVQELGEKVAATVTVHHLLLSTEDVRNGKLNPDHFCAPICKSEADRAALVQIALSGHPKFFFGSDSAPHSRKDKEGEHPKPGIYSTPVALPLLTGLFESHDKLDQLEDFTSRFGAEFYQLPQNQGQLSLVKEEWMVPKEYFGVVPLKKGERLKWKVMV